VVSISVYALVAGYLDGWMDFNRNGTWSDPGEHIFSSQAVSPGSNPLSFTVPGSATAGQTFLRFRFRDYPDALSYDGPATNGEVEDYRMDILMLPVNGWDFGDAPETGAAGTFPTTITANGARHAVAPGVFLGSKVDAEPDGQPNDAATGDDLDLLYPSSGDDEDGVVFTNMLRTGQNASVNVSASTNGYLDLWIDYSRDGTWAASNEHVLTSWPVTGGTNTISFSIPSSASPGFTYARFRFRTNNVALSYNGAASNGEVEDYRILIRDGSLPLMDFGDAYENPDIQFMTFPVTLARNGAAHIINPAVHLGNMIDAEPDGQPSVNATGDDLDLQFPSSGDDEDGVVFPASITTGTTVSFTVTPSVAGFLDFWMDIDRDSTWTGPADHIYSQKPVSAGINSLIFTVPANAVTGQTFLRFR
jgi:hypothetical protein